MNTRTLTLGTRASALALAQSQQFAQQLEAQHPNLKIKLKKITTSGDRIQDRFLSEVGGKGLFVKEIEESLLKKEIDFAVHSLKDMPAQLPLGLKIGCYPKRAEPWDVLVSSQALKLEELKQKAVIGTSSLRRRYQIQKIRPDLKFEMLRGNIDTRLKKLKEGQFDAIVLAKAGMQRLGLDLSLTQDLNIIPAPGQGTLAIETRENDKHLLELLAPLHDAVTEQEALAERFVMKALGGDCNLPLGVFAKINKSDVSLEVFLSHSDGTRIVEIKKEGKRNNTLKMAKEIINEID